MIASTPQCLATGKSINLTHQTKEGSGMVLPRGSSFGHGSAGLYVAVVPVWSLPWPDALGTEMIGVS